MMQPSCDSNRQAKQRPLTYSGCLTALTLLMIVGLMTGPAEAGKEVMVDGVMHIQNDATPSQGSKTLTLEEMWRVGGEDDDENLFGIVIQVLTDDDGHVYLLDLQLSEVQVFSSDGEYLKTLSREGEGPGEVRYPVDMLLTPAGNLGLVQSFPGKIIEIDLEGSPVGVHDPNSDNPTEGGFMTLIDARWRGDHYVLGGVKITTDMEAGSQTRTNFVASYTPESGIGVTYEEQPLVFEFSKLEIIEKDNYFPHLRRWTSDAEGRVFLASQRNQYLINVYNPDGTLARVIEREFTSWQRTEPEMARVNAQMEAQTRNIPFEVKTSVETTEPDITSLRVAPDGSIWVLTSRGGREQPDGIMQTYDVFNSEGHYIEQVAIACPGDGVEDGLIFMGSDRVIQVIGFTEALLTLQRQGGAATESEEGEEPAPMEVICYRVAG
jgi:hypothetical protein